jgi:cytochrome c oxidase subunit 4
MTNGRHDAHELWKGPGLVWLALLALLGITCAAAYVPLGAGNIAVNLCIAAVMVGILVTFLMDLRRSATLLRIVATAGLFWTALMFSLTFCDYLSRYY